MSPTSQANQTLSPLRKTSGFIRKFCFFVVASLLLPGAFDSMASNEKSYETEILNWRSEQESKLKSEKGWLTVVGLQWLHDGKNTVGSDPNSDVVLPKSAPDHFGILDMTKNHFSLNLDSMASAEKETRDFSISGKLGEPKKKYELISDEKGPPTEVRTGSVTFFLIKRGQKMGVRIKDAQAEARLHFTGRKWLEIKPEFRVVAKWVTHTVPMKLLVPDILGNESHEDCPGHAEFTLEGQLQKLYPTVEDGQLFFVFRDKTSGKETYGASRFLNADMPQNSEVVLDFNKAVNPPCAFTNYATCPLPPPENMLKVKILAGELAHHPH